MLFLFKSICATIDRLAEKDAPMDGADSESMFLKSNVQEQMRNMIDLLLEDCSHSTKQHEETDSNKGKKFQACCADLFVQHHMVHGKWSDILNNMLRLSPLTRSPPLCGMPPSDRAVYARH